MSTAAAQLEMFLSVFSALHYHRYMGRAVATLTILASTLAMALLAATFPYQLPSSLECPVTNTVDTSAADDPSVSQPIFSIMFKSIKVTI